MNLIYHPLTTHVHWELNIHVVAVLIQPLVTGMYTKCLSTIQITNYIHFQTESEVVIKLTTENTEQIYF